MIKKGSISINVLILIVLGLVVLAVVLFLVLGGADNWNVQTDCVQKGGICKDQFDCGNNLNPGGGTCSGSSQVCCKPISSSLI